MGDLSRARRPVLVAMDGSTRLSTAALLEREPGGTGNWRVVERRSDRDSHGQARVLLRLLDEMLSGTERTPRDLVAVVAGIGPGTFTGVRIAVATARALALALEIPVIGVSTLSALAAMTASGRLTTPPDVIVPVVDARRGQVFYGVYRQETGRNGPSSAGAQVDVSYVRSEAFAVCDQDALAERLPEGLRAAIVGDVDVLHGAGGGPLVAGVEVRLEPRAVAAEYLVVGQQALVEPDGGPAGSRLRPWLEAAVEGTAHSRATGEPGTPEGVRPIYVRAPDADTHIRKMRDPWAETALES